VNLSISCHALAKKQALLLAKRQPLALGQANVPVCALAFFDCCTTVLCMARCGKSAMIFRRNRKIANCNEFRLGIQPQ